MEGMVVVGEVATLVLLEECIECKASCISEDGFVRLCLAFVSKGNGGMGDPGGEWCSIGLGRLIRMV